MNTSFYCALQMLHFLQIGGLYEPCLVQVYRPSCFQQQELTSVSVSHYGNSCNCSNIFDTTVFVMAICGPGL